MSDASDDDRPTVPDGTEVSASSASRRRRVAVARRRLRASLRPGFSVTHALVGVLCAALGFALVTQVAATNSDDFLRTARTPDLVRLLGDLGDRRDSLDAEARRLEDTRAELGSGADRGAAALAESRRRAEALGVLTGTVEAVGEGVEVQVADPEGGVSAAVLLDTVQELRDAGAEAIQIGDVRVVASTAFLDPAEGSGVVVDGVTVQAPFEIRAVGDGATMAAAMAIPGGVVDTVSSAGGEAIVERRDLVTVDAVRELTTPRYARPGD
jgi:uncharacterized protein YlxW (UPF0749 family)